MSSDDEQYLKDLERAAGAVGGIPDAYGQLRGLLDSLPPGTAPSIKQAGTGAPDIAAGAGGIGGNLTIQSNVPIGSETGAGIGVVAAPFVGKSNFFNDGPMDSVQNASNFPVGPWPGGRASQDWYGYYTLAAGTNPNNYWTYRLRNHDAAYNSGMLFFKLDTFAAAALDITDTFVGPGIAGWQVNQETKNFPFIVGAVRITKSALTNTNLTSLVATLELWRDISWGDPDEVMIDSVSVDVLAMAINEQRQLVVSGPESYVRNGDEFYLKVYLRVVSTGTGNNVQIGVSEPQLSSSYTQSPPDFSPKLANYVPTRLIARYNWANNDVVIASKQISDTYDRLAIIETASKTELRFGSGAAATDAKLYRSGVGELTVENNLKVGLSLMVAGNYVEQASAGQNLIYNGGFRAGGADGASIDASGWVLIQNGDATSLRQRWTTNTSWTLRDGDIDDAGATNLGSSMSVESTAATGKDPYLQSSKIRVTPTLAYSLSALVGTHRVTGVHIEIIWYDKADTYISGVASATLANDLTKTGGPDITGWRRTTISGAVAPANAAYALVKLFLATPYISGTDCYAFWDQVCFTQSASAMAYVPEPIPRREGTAFPAGTPTVNDRFWRTDHRMEFYYDGTRWLCTCLHTLPIGHSITESYTATQLSSYRVGVPYLTTAGIYITTWNCDWYTSSGTLNSTNKWVDVLFLQGKDGGGSSGVIGTNTCDSGTAGHFKRNVVTINGVYDLDSYAALIVDSTLTGTNGAHYLWSNINYRHVAT